MYNKGCTEESELTIPEYILLEGKLVIADDNNCEKINLKNWYTIEVGANKCNSMTSLSLTDCPYLSSIIIGDNSFQGVLTLVISNTPLLNSFVVGADSFKFVTAMRIESIVYNTGFIA